MHGRLHFNERNKEKDSGRSEMGLGMGGRWPPEGAWVPEAGDDVSDFLHLGQSAKRLVGPKACVDALDPLVSCSLLQHLNQSSKRHLAHWRAHLQRATSEFELAPDLMHVTGD